MGSFATRVIQRLVSLSALGCPAGALPALPAGAAAAATRQDHPPGPAGGLAPPGSREPPSGQLTARTGVAVPAPSGHSHGRLLALLEFMLVAALLWGIDAVSMLRPGAEPAGLAHARLIESVSRLLGGGVMLPMNHWLAAHPLPAAAAAAWYIVPNVAVTGAAGLTLLLARPPRFALHRNALIAMGLIALTAWWLYPVAPPRMLPGYHDITATVVPVFAELFEGKSANQFAALPSIHVAWALWVAVAAQALLHRRAWRAAVWLYPVLTTLDVLATANHYLLDAVVAPATVALAYLLAWLASRVTGACRRRARPALANGRPPGSTRPGTSAPPGPLPSQTPAGRIRE